MVQPSDKSSPPDQQFITFFTDGTYVFGSHQNDDTCPSDDNGVEMGSYTWAPVGNVGSISFKASLQQLGDSNSCGVAPGPSGQTITKNADGSLTYKGGDNALTLTPVTFKPGSPIQGAFQAGASGTSYAAATADDGSAIIVFLDSAHLFLVESAGSIGDADDVPLIEDACYNIGSGNKVTVDFSSACKPLSGLPPIHTPSGADGGVQSLPSGTTLAVGSTETSTQLETLTLTIPGSGSLTLTHIPLK